MSRNVTARADTIASGSDTITTAHELNPQALPNTLREQHDARDWPDSGTDDLLPQHSVNAQINDSNQQHNRAAHNNNVVMTRLLWFKLHETSHTCS
jgi:hypothetical protein